MQGALSPDHLIEHVNGFLQAGNTGPAEPLLAALHHLVPDDPAIDELTARLAIQRGDVIRATEILHAALANHPDNAALLRCRADLRHRQGDLTGAAQDAAQAVLADPADPMGKAILGVLMTELGRAADGIACLAEAVAADPGSAAFREALARAQAEAGDTAAAADTLDQGIAAAPMHASLRNAAVLLACRRGNHRQALDLAEAARQYGHADACLLGLRAHALSCLGLHQEAGEWYAEALKLGPNDPYVRHLAATAGGRISNAAAPTEYVETLFDAYAANFDQSLIRLGYRIPGVIRAAVRTHVNLPANGLYGPALDLGCGTGLVAVALSDLPIGPIHGIDLSARMLAQAEQRNLYASLRQADLQQTLNQDEETYRLIFAADVLCYLGALDPLLAACFARLAPGGLMFASIEEAHPRTPAGNGWHLGPRGRYAHAPAYLDHVARTAGFTIVAMRPEVIRHEADAPVPGQFAVLRRTPS